MKKQINTLKGLALMGVLMLSTATFAQDAPVAEEKKSETTFGGYLDTYMKQNFSRQGTAGYTSFTGANNSFELGMASIYAEHKFDKASVFIDLGFGKRAEEFVYNNAPDNTIGLKPNSQMLIKQAYLSLEAGEGLKLTMGSWATHIGVELLNAYDNRNYSMSYAYSFSPLLNTGIKFNYKVEGLNVMVGATNAADFKSAVAAKDWPTGGQALAKIRPHIFTNLILGVITVAIGAGGRYV